MSTTSRTLGCIVALVAFSLSGGTAVAKPSPGPQIAASSCGGTPVPPTGNAFCSFEGTGEGVVIGQNSCNVEGACILIGNGARIGHDSCNAEVACTILGTLNGVVGASGFSMIGNRSCNGLEACTQAGTQGFSVIGNDSCNGGDAACAGAGQSKGTSYIGDHACNNLNIGASHNTCLFIASGDFDTVDGGHIVIGNGSCNGSSACTFGAQFGATSTIGNNACNGLGACFDVAQGPFPGIGVDFQSASVIGNASCNAESACEFAGVAGSSAIGNHSCNGEPDRTNPDFPIGVCDFNQGVIGNNQKNSP